MSARDDYEHRIEQLATSLRHATDIIWVNEKDDLMRSGLSIGHAEARASEVVRYLREAHDKYGPPRQREGTAQ